MDLYSRLAPVSQETYHNRLSRPRVRNNPRPSPKAVCQTAIRVSQAMADDHLWILCFRKETGLGSHALPAWRRHFLENPSVDPD